MGMTPIYSPVGQCYAVSVSTLGALLTITAIQPQQVNSLIMINTSISAVAVSMINCTQGQTAPTALVPLPNQPRPNFVLPGAMIDFIAVRSPTFPVSISVTGLANSGSVYIQPAEVNS